MEEAWLNPCAATDDHDHDRHSVDSQGSESEDDKSAPPAMTAPLRTGGPQTGPKGVLADKAHHDRMERERQQQKLASYSERIRAKAPTTTTFLQDQRNQALLAQARAAQQKDADEDDLRSDSDDDEIMAKYRERRLAEFHTVSTHDMVKEVDADGFLEVTESAAGHIPVLVHIYDMHIPACRVLDHSFQQLAAKHHQVASFARVRASVLEFDLVGSPAILVYQNGELILNLVGLTSEVSDLSLESLERLFISKHVLPKAGTASSAGQVRHRMFGSEQDDSDDFE